MIHMTLDYGAELLAEYLGDAWDTHRAKVMLGYYDACLLALEWETRQTEHGFYTNSALYLLEGIHWNLSQAFQAYQDRLTAINGQRVLDFGGGIGTITHQLVQQGNKVYYCDINRPCREFARWWGQKLGVPALGYYESLNLIPPVADIVIAIDVFEHLEDLQDVLNELSARMDIGGRIYVAPSFGFQAVYPMHHDYFADYRCWLKEAGFGSPNRGWVEKVA